MMRKPGTTTEGGGFGVSRRWTTRLRMHRSRGRPPVAALLATALLLATACGGDAPPEDGPFTVRFETSAGLVEVEFVPEWSPLAVDRVRELAEGES